MDMTPQTAWLIAISAVVLVGVVAFFIGRSTAGTKGRIDELEAELSSKKAEVEGYRKEVEQHLDKTATLFVSMAGSYKEMFEHVSSGYEKLSSGSARELFQQRVDALLIGSARSTGAADDAGKLLGGAAAAGTGVAAAAAAAVSAADTDAVQAGTAVQADTSAASETSVAAEGSAEPEWRAEPTLGTGAQGAAAASQAESETVAADESDERVRMAEGIAFDPTVDEAPVRSEAPHSELR
jgi:uncharacterized membrane-anchored protein YhcB (DUF1043 family)